MTSEPPAATRAFSAMLLALLRRTSGPQIDDPAHFLDSEDVRRYPAAMLVALCGADHPRSESAVAILGDGSDLSEYFCEMRGRIGRELNEAMTLHPDLIDTLAAAGQVDAVEDEQQAFDLVWGATFPEGVGLQQDWSGAVERLRRRRRIVITGSNQDPIVNPIREVLFTSNVLITPTATVVQPDHSYDHPIPLDAAPRSTELAHGLLMLDSAVAFEIGRNPGWRGPATVVLSVSSTHEGWESSGCELVERVVAAVGPLPNLRVFVFDEMLTRQLWEQVIMPAAKHCLGQVPARLHRPVFGVSGPYGRHYSFLKAVAALWSVCIDKEIRATFKVDLDQSFPEIDLVAETGQSAFEHLATSRWGASGLTFGGKMVDLVMIAGSLVNEEDIARSVFTPDVEFVPPSSSEDAIFFGRLPQALSTEAEMVPSYGISGVDGVATAQERVHVTGGTNGILVSGLRRWRLFTPSVLGRAEDQAYLLSGMRSEDVRPGYVHEPGLIMRHDKARLIPGVIRQSEASKHIGDLVRTRLFSAYAGSEDKKVLDPFTGCFVSRLPLTVTLLRLVLRSLDAASEEAAQEYLSEGVRRLRGVDDVVSDLSVVVNQERDEWDVFYDSLDALESGIAAGESWATAARAAAQCIVDQAATGTSL